MPHHESAEATMAMAGKGIDTHLPHSGRVGGRSRRRYQFAASTSGYDREVLPLADTRQSVGKLVASILQFREISRLQKPYLNAFDRGLRRKILRGAQEAERRTAELPSRLLLLDADTNHFEPSR